MKVIKILQFCIVFIFVANVASAQVCPRTGTGAVDVLNLAADPNGSDFNCDYTPDGMQIKLYKILLCESLPTLANYTSVCSPLVNFPSGKTVSITADGTTPILDGPVTLTEGSYSHAGILIENIIGSIFTQNFSLPLHGSNQDGGTGVGTTCWSNGNDAKIFYPGGFTEFSASCGLETEANPKWSNYTYKGFWTPGGFVNSAPLLTLNGSGKDVYLLADQTSLAPISYDNSGNTEEQNLTTQANYLLGVTKLEPAATIGPNTSNIDLGFKLKDTFFQKISTSNAYGAGRCSNEQGSRVVSGTTGAHACLATSYATTFDFRFLVE